MGIPPLLPPLAHLCPGQHSQRYLREGILAPEEDMTLAIFASMVFRQFLLLQLQELFTSKLVVNLM